MPKNLAIANHLRLKIVRTFPFLIPKSYGGIHSYALTLALMGLALWVRLLIAPVDAGLQYVTFFPAVTLAAIIGGYRAGLLATTFGLALATYIFTPPYYSISWAVFQTSLWSNIVFLIDGIIISFSIEGMHRFRDKYSAELKQSTEAHAALKEYTLHHREILDNLFAYVALLDADGKVQEINKAYLDRAGLIRCEVIGKFFFDILPWSYDEQIQAQLKQAIEAAKNGESQRFDVTLKMGNDLVPTDFQISPVFDESGKVIGILPTGVDISERTKIERALRESENKFHTLFESTTDCLTLLSTDGRILDINHIGHERLGYTKKEMLGRCITEFYSPECTVRLQERVATILRDGHALFESVHLHKLGSSMPVEVSCQQIELNGESILFSAIRDITERKKTEEALKVAAVVFDSHDAIMITDEKSNIIRVNQAFTDITGYDAEDVIGQNPSMMSSGRHDKTFYFEMWQQLQHEGSWSGEIWDKRKNGLIYPRWMTITAVKNELRETTHYVAIFSDITARKKTEEEIRNLAFYDSLTLLPNRRLFMDRFRAALTISARRNDYGALLFIDLDRFKVLNDTLGHDYGDLLLIEVAVRIKSCVREMDTVARLGGDEFVVLIEGVDEDQDETSRKVGLLAEKIREALVQPYMLKLHEHLCSPSIGISLYCGHTTSVDALIQQADMAMYQAKDSGRNTVRFFDPLMQEKVSKRATLEHDLHNAISNGQLHLYYQIQMGNQHPIGAEALLRWMHPLRGLILPSEFIPIAEEGTLILDIGNWVLETGCHQLAQWATKSHTNKLTLALNISSKQFALPNFVAQVEGLLLKYQINPTLLKLELTESIVLNDKTGMAKKMHALRALGVHLSMDDFGTGYSSLSYLKDLPLDQIKIDQGFVQDITSSGSNAMLVQTIIDLANNFNLNVIAEGVETEAQLTFLKHHDCMAYQGFLFSEAVSIDEFEALLKTY